MNPNSIYLVQTDTTVGFSSFDDEKLSNIKQRDNKQKILKTIDSFTTLNSFVRVPKKFRRIVRNSKKTTFIYPNLNSFRVISKDELFHDFIKKFKVLSSTSANYTKKSFDYDFAFEKCDVEVVNNIGFSEKIASKIYKIGKKSIKKIR
ncbi:Sua5 YciO YrdC YwlC family protein [Aliarcobacter trophiarum LMG 25534]|uniref:Sua5 YciO YrdC YwlC family protein n=1 Tax=Aliarcobacter trophiarum LMG 25534 TaxID=1032241 RepID=A0AAD0QJ64_9BACT|nr:Sua5 YciO YrdC YwlC family protein [Aliarcobacter trophiarum]AXK48686.1 threonylcarbamoyl-AMP synthase TsaC [Aliarcobacter trophiarum LMG 25534]RXI27421.1 Sua5 YciO YrdC YwlC family protein [Aliarcobacter trophiarum]RXJ91368.1 Sua5 YciO YrdC YwlC family protein [Aliarcobacter trophiarum LMG 25534]